MANLSGVYADEAGSADNLLTAVFRVHAINHQRQAVACAGTAAVTCKQALKIILMQQADGGVIHLADNQAVRQLLIATFIQEFLFQVRRRHGLFRSEKQIAHGRPGIAQEGRTAMSIGLIEIRTGTARHQFALERSVFHYGHLLGPHALIVNRVGTEEWSTLKFLGAGIVDYRHGSRQNTCSDPSNPVTLSAESAQQLFHYGSE